jgi:hypothetical protein
VFLTFSSALNQNQILATLLHGISDQLDVTSRKRVIDALKHVDVDTPSLTPPTSVVSQGKRPKTASSLGDHDDKSSFSENSGSLDHNDDINLLEEDLLRNSDARKTGYMGRSSHARWLRDIHAQMDEAARQPFGVLYELPESRKSSGDDHSEAFRENEIRLSNNGYFTHYSFYLDDVNIDIELVDPYVIPPAETAEKLLELYKVATHDPFRLLDDVFEKQFRMYLRSIQEGGPMNVCPKWRAILNLVFAIGAGYSHLVGINWRADDRDHRIYMWRAVQLLDLKSVVGLISAPDLSFIRVGFHPLVRVATEPNRHWDYSLSTF